MKAKEMFKELGYLKTENDICIEYIKQTDKHWVNTITFSKHLKYYIVCFDSTHTNKQVPMLIKPKEHQVITQQMKELGWVK